MYNLKKLISLSLIGGMLMLSSLYNDVQAVDNVGQGSGTMNVQRGQHIRDLKDRNGGLNSPVEHSFEQGRQDSVVADKDSSSKDNQNIDEQNPKQDQQNNTNNTNQELENNQAANKADSQVNIDNHGASAPSAVELAKEKDKAFEAEKEEQLAAENHKVTEPNKAMETNEAIETDKAVARQTREQEAIAKADNMAKAQASNYSKEKAQELGLKNIDQIDAERQQLQQEVNQSNTAGMAVAGRAVNFQPVNTANSNIVGGTKNAVAQSSNAGAATASSSEAKQESELKIVINTAARSLSVIKDGKRARLYPVGLGKTNTPTPIGYYNIQEKETNPTWTDPSRPNLVIESGPDNPLGYRWMRFSGNYGIHGTNNEASIGGYVSNGCVRMKEADVEDLFNLVEVNTPVEIFYNRVVVEKTDNDMIVYYIYPDGYNMQPITADMVDDWLKGYGVNSFESDDAIIEKINASDGNPTYIAQIYPLVVDGTKLNAKAVLKDGIFYLPAVPIADKLKLPTGYQNENGLLFTKYGRVPGQIFKNTLYLNGDDVETLFHLQGGLENHNFVLNSIQRSAVEEKQAQSNVQSAQGTQSIQTAQIVGNAQNTTNAQNTGNSQGVVNVQKVQNTKNGQTVKSVQSNGTIKVTTSVEVK